MTREQAVSIDGMWAGLGPGGSAVVEAGPGDFLYVPKGAIHREGNPGDEESRLVVVRAGHGPAVVNVDGPAMA
jgi:uncharacterized RmlC-like cupin family protein